MADTKAYAETLLKAAKGVTEEQKTAFLAVLGDPEVAKTLDETLTHHMNKSDYDRELGRVKKKETDLQDWYKTQVTTAQQNQATVEAAQNDVKRYIEAYGVLPDGTPAKGTPAVAAADYISKKDLEGILSTRDQQTIQLVKGVGDITADHITRFGEKPDLNEIEKIAIEQKLPLNSAYEKYIAPKLAAKQATDFDARIKAAKEEGLKEGLSRSGIPVDAKPKEPHPFFDRKPLDKVVGKPSDSFVSGWNEATAAK